MSKTAGVKTDYSDIGPAVRVLRRCSRTKMVLARRLGPCLLSEQQERGRVHEEPAVHRELRAGHEHLAASNGVPNHLPRRTVCRRSTFAQPASSRCGNVIGYRRSTTKSDRAQQFNLMIEKRVCRQRRHTAGLHRRARRPPAAGRELQSRLAGPGRRRPAAALRVGLSGGWRTRPC